MTGAMRSRDKEGSVSYIVLAVLSAALIRLAIACVYSRRIYWDE
jgi:NADH:ubiquinone oxidoreductase subunit 2 (subunit N)